MKKPGRRRASCTAAHAARLLDDPVAAVTVSIGVAQRTADMAGPDALLRQADKTTYQAMDLGRNTAVKFSKSKPQPQQAGVP